MKYWFAICFSVHVFRLCSSGCPEGVAQGLKDSYFSANRMMAAGSFSLALLTHWTSFLFMISLTTSRSFCFSYSDVNSMFFTGWHTYSLSGYLAVPISAKSLFFQLLQNRICGALSIQPFLWHIGKFWRRSKYCCAVLPVPTAQSLQGN